MEIRSRKWQLSDRSTLCELHFVNSERLRELFLNTLNPTDYAAHFAFPRSLNYLALPCFPIVRERYVSPFVLQEVEIVECCDAEMIHVRFSFGESVGQEHPAP